MSKVTKQILKWKGDFGKTYTDRNTFTLKALNKIYEEMYGLTCAELNKTFLGSFSRDIKILEVGTNIGNQLSCLKEMGFTNLYGIEINHYAAEAARKRLKNAHIVRGSALDVPFKDDCFDLVFTSGVLIHISPGDIKQVLGEIFRCSRQYIWGYEYYAQEYTEIPYRGNDNLMWKANFPCLYTDAFKNLKLEKKKMLPYLQSGNVDVMFLLRKK